jgi:hypothetical protein
VASGLVAPVSRTQSILERNVLTLASTAAAHAFERRVHTEMPTQLVGLEWDGAVEGAVEVRSRNGGRWSGWTRIEGSPGEGPDADSHEYRPHTTAGPLYVGRDARDLDVRVVEGRLRNLRLHTIRTEDREPSALATALGTAPASADPAWPNIIPRSGWGADESWRSHNPDCGTPAYASRVRNAFIHHTVNANNYGADEVPAILRGIYHFHVFTNGWCDIGYNVIVDRFGRPWEGRFGGLDRPVIGAHTGGYNTGSTGIAMLGTFSTVSPPPVMYDTVRRVLTWKFGVHGVDAKRVIEVIAGRSDGSRYPEGARVAVWTISGHRDVWLTECPGGLGASILERLRTDVQRDVTNTIPYPIAARSPDATGPRLLALDAYGGLHPAGTQRAVPHTAFWPGWAIARGAVKRSDGVSGYVLDGHGGIHPFGGAPHVAGGPGWPGWDIARGIVLRSNGVSGYVLDGYGGIHPFGGAPHVAGGPGWPGWDIARGIALRSDGVSGYVLDGYGGIHPFGGAPRLAGIPGWPGSNNARGIALRPDGVSGYVLDLFGLPHPFGGAPNVGTTNYTPGRDRARGLALTSDGNGGWTVDAAGNIWPFGTGAGVFPSLTWEGLDLGRAIVAG